MCRCYNMAHVNRHVFSRYPHLGARFINLHVSAVSIDHIGCALFISTCLCCIVLFISLVVLLTTTAFLCLIAPAVFLITLLYHYYHLEMPPPFLSVLPAYLPLPIYEGATQSMSLFHAASPHRLPPHVPACRCALQRLAPAWIASTLPA